MKDMLKGVQFIDCPVVSAAPEQAIVVQFNELEWLNYRDDPEGKEIKLESAVLTPISMTGTTKAFVVTWFAVAHDVSDDQCPTMNTKPTE